MSAFPLIVALLIWGCDKEETKIYYQGGTPPNLTATPGSDFNYANADETALILSWTNPEYMFTTGVNSHDVSYRIEIDTTSDFSNPSKKVISVSKDLTYTFRVSDLNDIMLNDLNLQVDASHTLQIRVVSSLNNSVPLASNAVQFTAIAYSIPPKVEPPSSDSLFITGSATHAGWMVGGEISSVPASQIFTRLDEMHYTITVNLIGGQEYLWVPVRGDWSHKYAVPDNSLPNLWMGGDFKADASDNFPGPPTDGDYKIDVDFQKGKFTVTKQ